MSGAAFKSAKPILSRNHTEARRKVLHLYKAWYRQLPFIKKDYADTYVTVTVEEMKVKLREEFDKNKDGQNELIECAHLWKSDTQVMDYFHDVHRPKPKGFINKFLSGHQD